MTERRLHVAMGSEVVADLIADERSRLALHYRDTWVAAADPTPLSVAMPVASTSYGHEVVEPYLWGLLPDDDQVVERWARQAECSARDVFGLLAHRGADVAGAARYLATDVPVDDSTGGHEPVTDDEVGELLRRVVEDRPVWAAPAEPGRWSLAGAQAKIALARDPGTGRWSIPTGAAATTHILKPGIRGFADIDLDEHLCLATARQLGLRAAATAVEVIGGERSLVVERYDRRALPGGGVARIHQEDLAQALGVHPRLKYENDGGPPFRALARLVRSVTSGDPQPQVEALCRSVAFDWLVLAPDSHAKNHSLLLSGRQVRMAPMYDVASILPYDVHPRKVKLAQKVGGEYRVTVIAGRHWDRLAAEAGVDLEWMRVTVAELATNLPAALDQAITAADLDGEDRRFAHRLREGLAAWAAQCARAVGRS